MKTSGAIQVVLLVTTIFFYSGCGTSSLEDVGQGDANVQDAGFDAGFDGGGATDAGKDASADASMDGSTDGSVATDGGPDGSVEDGGSKVQIDPKTIPKYVSPMVIPPAMPYETKTPSLTEYKIAVRQFREQILPPGYPKTTVWGYGRANDPPPSEGGASTFNSPAFTVETRSNEKVRVTWVNGFVDSEGNYLQHLLPVDRTIHWFNPGNEAVTKENALVPYTGPIPITTHVHGAHVESHSDGHPDSWWMPDAKNIPQSYVTKGMYYNTQAVVPAGQAVFEYSNSQRAATLWYHDHTLGITRLNPIAGMAGFWIIRDGEEDALGLPGPAPHVGDAADTKYYEIPIAVQDRIFNTDGSIFYPSSREWFGDYSGPYIPDAPVSPMWVPEFFGNTMMVNGVTWPYLEVEPRLYRFRFLNGCNARTLIMKFNWTGLNFTVIGNEGGLLAGHPVTVDKLIAGPAERLDVLVDFSNFTVGQEIVLLNEGPDEPFATHSNGVDIQQPADPETTGQVMKFKIVALTGSGTPGVIPASLPEITPLASPVRTRDVTLNEMAYMPYDVPVMAVLGTSEMGPLGFHDTATETPKKGDTEIWRIVNLTADGHPIHLHLVHFQVLDRTPFNVDGYSAAEQAWLASTGPMPDVEDFLTGPAIPAYPWENGWKETVIADEGMVTRFIANFDIAGNYVWHCHILEHEENDMMRPLIVLP